MIIQEFIRKVTGPNKSVYQEKDIAETIEKIQKLYNRLDILLASYRNVETQKEQADKRKEIGQLLQSFHLYGLFYLFNEYGMIEEDAQGKYNDLRYNNVYQGVMQLLCTPLF